MIRGETGVRCDKLLAVVLGLIVVLGLGLAVWTFGPVLWRVVMR